MRVSIDCLAWHNDVRLHCFISVCDVIRSPGGSQVMTDKFKETFVPKDTSPLYASIVVMLIAAVMMHPSLASLLSLILMAAAQGFILHHIVKLERYHNN